MSTDSPRPERVTLSDEERSLLADAFDHEVEANCWREACEEGIWDVTSRILAAREQALREEIANAKAEALRGQARFFRSVDMLAAADLCEQSAIGWDAAAFDATRGAR